MNTSKNKRNANELCKSTGCGDTAFAHDNLTGKCNVFGCKCESFVGTCSFSWFNNQTNQTYQCTEPEGHKTAHTDGINIWYTDGKPAMADHAADCVNNPSKLCGYVNCKHERRVHVTRLATGFTGCAVQGCQCYQFEEHEVQPAPPMSFDHGGETVFPASTFERTGGKVDYEAARAGARKALGSSPLTGKDKYEQNIPLPIETAVNAHVIEAWKSLDKTGKIEVFEEPWQKERVRFMQIEAVHQTNGFTVLFALDSDGQLWVRGLATLTQWQLDTMPVR